jgi:hypothetical protein
MSTNITPTAIRLFARALEIQDLIDDFDDAELLAHSERVLRRSAKHLEDIRAGRDIVDDDDEDDNRALYAEDPEYLRIKTALAKELKLGPQDTNPLDVQFDPEWEGPDDPRIPNWRRALDLRLRLSDAHLNWICWWRPSPPSTTSN